MGVPGVNPGVTFFGSRLRLWWALPGREHRQDSEAVNESLWDGQDVEVEVGQCSDGIRGRGEFRWVENIARIRKLLARASGTA